MPLDPQAVTLLERIKAANAPQYWQVSAPEARELYVKTRAAVSPPLPEVAHVENLHMQGPAGDIALRYYRAHGTNAADVLPVLVFFHGGGWVIGDLDTHDNMCRALANAGRCALVSVDYRLAPEHKFPGAVDDAIAATHWVYANAAMLKIDPARIAVGGDSAGGNLAAVVSIHLRNTARERAAGAPGIGNATAGPGPNLSLQLLAYPALDFTNSTASHRDFADGYLLTRKSMEWFAEQYLRGSHDVRDWRASPTFATDLSNLPPAFVITAGFDPLRDEGKAYADKLQAAGVGVTYECFEGMIHGFMGMGGVLAAGNHAIYRAGQALRTAFASASESQAAALHRTR